MTEKGFLTILNKDEDSVSFIETEARRYLQVVPVGGHPHEVALTPRGKAAYDTGVRPCLLRQKARSAPRLDRA
jgi:DNA-binding beta-propeller fold protein YncE